MAERRSGAVVVVAVVCAAVIAGAMAIRAGHRRAAPAPVAADWYEGAAGFASAERAQQASGAPMLVYFHTDWCGYCKRFERELLPASAVDRALFDVVKVRLNPERSAGERAIADRYGVHGYPSLFLERAGRRVRLRPFTQTPAGWVEQTPEQFVAQLQTAAR